MLNIDKVHHVFPPKKVLYNIQLKVEQGQFVALVGPSGCGKSTLLRAVLGTDAPSQGVITLDREEIIGPSRNVGIVYQRYSLYPFLTVEQNVAFGLMLDQTNGLTRWLRPLHWYRLRQSHLKQARDLLDEVGLAQALRCYPCELSGGMQQRVAIAQALIMKPKLLLLDEPFGALDEATREELQVMLLKLYQENIIAKKKNQQPPYTVIIVTHELNEAFYISDRVVGLSRFWQVEGLRGEDLGATVMYDKAAPGYSPSDPKDFNRFADLKSLLRKVVFDESAVHDPDEHCTFWSDSSEH